MHYEMALKGRPTIERQKVYPATRQTTWWLPESLALTPSVLLGTRLLGR